MTIRRIAVLGLLLSCAGLAARCGLGAGGKETRFDSTAETLKGIAKLKVKPTDWPQWGGSPLRNNTPSGQDIPSEWNVDEGDNIKWSARLGSQTFGSPVVANGKVFIGTNNGAGYVKRYPTTVDIGVLIALDQDSGKFLWQLSREKLPTGRVHDWPFLGICSTPFADGDRVWCVTNRNEIMCLDAEGFHDGENDGPYKEEVNQNIDEADIIWSVDLMAKLGVSQHNACSCAITCVGDFLFALTANGVDEAHKKVQYPDAPSFLAMNKHTGEVLWTDNSPGSNVMHGQWSSPTYAVLGDVAQVIIPGGDGWVYSFDPKGENGKSKLLWKFDCNPKESVYTLERATRNPIIAMPVAYDGLIYIAVGEDVEHGEGRGHLWCIDPTKRGDVSPELVFNKKDPKTPIAYKRLKACEPEKGDFTQPNPNSAAVWHYVGEDSEQPEQTMHRAFSSVAVKDDLLFIADQSGIVHCLDSRTGKAHWTHDMLASCWATPIIVEGKVYIGDEDGDVSVFELSKEKNLVAENNMGSAVYGTPAVAGNVMYLARKDMLFAIAAGAKSAKSQ
jgi:outer membrane protein assembly factor BamB